MIKRDAESSLKKFASEYPVVAILGPRQSGKTTLAQMVFTNHRYVSFEDIDMRLFARNDPRKFLADNENKHGLILDEIQHVPDLLSYIQTYVDAQEQPGYFILTGSQNFMVNQTVSQTLAGRIAILTLLPLSIHELKKNDLLPPLVDTTIGKGGYPRIYAKDVSYLSWYPFYIQMYVERDVRQITSIQDLAAFERFLKLCAGRIGQLLNMSSLANDCGISVTTVRSWISLLQASYVIFLLEPHYKNFSKRLIKAPKLYFFDTGIAAALLGIKSDEQLASHYLYGGLFESLVMSELFKSYYNSGQFPHIYFWRDSIGHEVDCIIEHGQRLTPLEIKSGYTINSDYFSGLNYWNGLSGFDPSQGFVVYGGDRDQKRSEGTVVSWRNIDRIVS